MSKKHSARDGEASNLSLHQQQHLTVALLLLLLVVGAR